MNNDYPFRLHPHKMHKQTAAEYEEAKRHQAQYDADLEKQNAAIREEIAKAKREAMADTHYCQEHDC